MNVGHVELSYTILGNVKYIVTLEKQFEVSYKVKHTAYIPRIPFLSIYTREMKAYIHSWLLSCPFSILSCQSRKRDHTLPSVVRMESSSWSKLKYWSELASLSTKINFLKSIFNEAYYDIKYSLINYHKVNRSRNKIFPAPKKLSLCSLCSYPLKQPLS